MRKSGGEGSQKKRQGELSAVVYQSGCPLERPLRSASSKCLQRLILICLMSLQEVHCNFKVIFLVVLA